MSPPKIPPIFFIGFIIQCSIYVHAYQALVHFSTWIDFYRGCWYWSYWHEGAKKKFPYAITNFPPNWRHWIGKVSGPSGIVIDILKAEKEFGIEWLTDLCIDIIAECKIPTDWNRNLLVPVNKDEGIINIDGAAKYFTMNVGLNALQWMLDLMLYNECWT